VLIPASPSPAISVVIPTYNRPEALARTLTALARQEGGDPFEVVVCDDGSPEPAAAQVSQAVEMAAQATDGAVLARIRLVRQPNAGPAAARNHGAREAAASLLLFLDDDCRPLPDLVATHVQEHRLAGGGDPIQSVEPVAVMGHVAWDPALRVTPFMELVVRGAQFNYGAIADPERVPFTCFYTANVSLRRTDLAAAGWFDASLPPYMEDTEFAYRFTAAGGRIVYRPQARVLHEHHVELAAYLDRQRRAGRAAVEVARRHPELFDVVGVGDVANPELREQFYAALLRYAFILGVEEGLAGAEQGGAVTGAELRSQFEQWTASWAIHQASRLRAWRERAQALEQEVARRDQQLAEVVQEKDAQIARLEAHLARFDSLLPVRLLRAVTRRRGSGYTQPNGG
jgi:GT2 family glycosyltransferase